MLSSPNFRNHGFALKGLALAVFALIVLVGKLLLISSFGNNTPFWDQWDAEAATLYKNWILGTSSLQSWLAPHCEHRIFTTRLVHLALFELNGREWSPILQMRVNAVIHIAALCVSLAFLGTLLKKKDFLALCLFGCLLFAIPFGWENTLAGFQTQFYLIILLSIALLWICALGKLSPTAQIIHEKNFWR